MYSLPSAAYWGILLSLLLCSSIVPEATAEDSVDPLLSIFRDSAAPTFLEKESELVLERGFRQWERNSHWHPDIDEQTVYLCRMQHRCVEERSWEIGIGKGGHIYSIVSSFGEAMPPQTPEAPWMDEAWQMTTIYEHLLGRDLHERTNDANSFVHQSGIYVLEEDAHPFYSPMLTESFDPKRRAWSGVCWGQIPTASVNRSGVLIYANYRDMGAGVIEITWLTVNFEPEPLTNLGAWGGVRTSKFPEQTPTAPTGITRRSITAIQDLMFPAMKPADGRLPCRMPMNQTPIRSVLYSEKTPAPGKISIAPLSTVRATAGTEHVTTQYRRLPST